MQNSREEKPAISTEKLITVELRRIVARESDDLLREANEMVNTFAKKEISETQINGLISVTNATHSTSPIIRFIQRQGGRREAWQNEKLADTLLKKIQEIREKAEVIAEEVQSRLRHQYGRSGPEVEDISNKKKGLPEVHYLLAREFIHAFSMAYLYECAKEKQKSQKSVHGTTERG